MELDIQPAPAIECSTKQYQSAIAECVFVQIGSPDATAGKFAAVEAVTITTATTTTTIAAETSPITTSIEQPGWKLNAAQ